MNLKSIMRQWHCFKSQSACFCITRHKSPDIITSSWNGTKENNVGDDDLPHLKNLYFYNGNSVVNKLSCCNLRLRQTFYCQQSQETVQYELKESNAIKQLQNVVSYACTCIRYIMTWWQKLWPKHLHLIASSSPVIAHYLHCASMLNMSTLTNDD